LSLERGRSFGGGNRQSKVSPSLLYPCQEEGLRASTHHHQACSEVYGKYVRKNPWATAGDIKEKVPEVAAVGLCYIRKLLVVKLRLP
jgi:hypothetical protein